MNSFSILIATFLGVGYFPAAPGTAATVIGGLLAFLLQGTIFYYTVTVFVLIVLGIFVSSHVEKLLNQTDPGIVVIDEVAGMMIALFGLPFSWPIAICGFFLFRAMDMFKIYPINKLESMPGGWGIMLDDVMAGVYTNIILSIAVRWAGVI